ncbi:TPA: MalY/PatB family protein [Yersinia enterocolitica]
MNNWVIQYFDVPVVRRGSHSSKWDKPCEDDVLPFSVADMDFYAPPAVLNTLSENIRHGIFGYPYIPEKYFYSIIEWFFRRHNFRISRDWILCASGVDLAISSIIKSITSQGDEIIIQEPVYNVFISCIENSGCRVIVNNLIFQDGQYHIDFDDLENKAARALCRVLILCNPHNPIGKVWSEEELAQVGNICMRHGVVVISDESHCDIIFGNNKHVPFLMSKKNMLCSSVVCTSPSKSFNLSGIRQANLIINNFQLREKIKISLEKDFASDISIFAISSLISAYDDSEWWLENVKFYIYRNYRLLCKYMRLYLPKCRVVELQGSYLAWIDISSTGLSGEQIFKLLKTEARIVVNSGSIYGESGKYFIRVNLACRSNMLREAFKRLKYMHVVY